MGELPPRRDLLGDRLQGAVDPAPARRPGKLAAFPQPEDGVEHHPLERGPEPGGGEVVPHRHQPDRRPRDDGPAGSGMAPQQPPEHQRDGEHEVRAVGEGEAGEYAGAEPDPPAPRRVLEVRPADREHGRPQRQGEAAVPGHRGQRDRREHVEDRERSDGRGRRPAPRPGEGEEGEDDPEVLEQAERPLGGERVAEDLVPPAQHVQRSRPVQVQEVDVGDVAGGDPLGEVEHEALLHRPAREAVETAQRDHDEPDDDGDAQPRPDRALLTAAQPAGSSQHERRLVVVDRPRRSRGLVHGQRHERQNLLRRASSSAAMPERPSGAPLTSRPRDRTAAGAEPVEQAPGLDGAGGVVWSSGCR